MKNTIVNIYTLCDDSCECGKHNSNYEICSRCGSHIHTKIYSINTYNGVINVGSECFKDVMGYNFNKYHEKALKLHKLIVDKITEIKKIYNIEYELKLKVRNFAKEISIEYPNGLWLVGGKLNKSIIRSGVDLDLWESINDKSIEIKN